MTSSSKWASDHFPVFSFRSVAPHRTASFNFTAWHVAWLACADGASVYVPALLCAGHDGAHQQFMGCTALASILCYMLDLSFRYITLCVSGCNRILAL